MASAPPSTLAPPSLPAAGRIAPGGAWLWGARADLAVFGGSAALGLALAALAPTLSPDGSVSDLGWLLLVVAIDVAHVWSTLFRTYLDPEELRRRPGLYAGVPLACYAAGLALHLASSLLFWRVLAYLAVFHFVRQQAGWAAVYRARAGERRRLDRILDDALVYAATGYPLLHWHANLPARFRWFLEGDFVSLPAARALLPAAAALYALLLAAYVVRALLAWLVERRVNWGKHVVVFGTCLVWYAGIVGFREAPSDFSFTATNVIAHGVPYMALLFAYARARGREAPATPSARLVALGLPAFLGVCLALALFEELLWDRLVWHERPDFFGGTGEPLLGPLALSLVVPLLALPQATHYALDAVLWRRGAGGRAQAEALGFGRKES